MKIDILGRGRAPQLNLLAPSYGVELSFVELEKAVTTTALKMYVAGTNIAIHRRNYRELYDLYSSSEQTAEAPKEVKKAAPKKKAEPIEQVAEPVTEKDLEPVVEAPVEEPKEAVEVKEDEAATIEATENFDDAAEATEAVEEDKPQYSSKKKNKKNK
jgi:hypothetical protein